MGKLTATARRQRAVRVRAAARTTVVPRRTAPEAGYPSGVIRPRRALAPS